MDLIVAVLIGIAGGGATVFVAFRTIELGNAQTAEMNRLLGDVRVVVGRVEQITSMTQESLVRGLDIAYRDAEKVESRRPGRTARSGDRARSCGRNRSAGHVPSW